MLERLTRAVVRRRFAVLACWIAVLAAGEIAATQLQPLLSASLAVPGTPSQRAGDLLATHFDDSLEGSFTVVVRTRDTSQAALQAIGRRLRRAAGTLPGAVATPVLGGAGIAYGGIDTSLDLQQAADLTGEVRAALARAGLGGALVTGPPALQRDLTPVLQSDLRRGELLAAGVALLVLLVVLGWSWSLLVPFAVAACTTATVLGALDGIARGVLVVLYVPNLVQLIGLGLAIDYSLLVVRRFREELAAQHRQAGAGGAGAGGAGAGAGGAGGVVEEAVVSTMATAGRTVVASGITASIGLCVLLVVPVPFVRSLGLAGLLVPLASVGAAVTLLPALLALLGGRAAAHPAWPGLGERRGPGREARGWGRAAGVVERHPWRTLCAALGAVALAALPSAWLSLTPASVAGIPPGIPSARGLAALTDRAGPGAISPIVVVLDSGRGGGAASPAVQAATLRLGRALLTQPAVVAVAIGSRPPYVDATGRYGEVVVVGGSDLGSAAMRRLVAVLRQHLITAARFPPGVRLLVGGAPAQGVDFLHEVYGVFPMVAGIVLLATALVLVAVFGSLLLALLAVVLDACSVAAAYGITVLVFDSAAIAGPLGLYRTGQIEGWVPVFVFAVLFGLSMDYEVFVVARIREEHRAGRGHAEAVRRGIASTAPVVTAAALVMAGAVSGLAAGRVAGLQELGVALAAGVLIDATVVRGLLLPGVMAVAGPACWWLPAWLAGLLDTGARPAPGDADDPARRGGGGRGSLAGAAAQPGRRGARGSLTSRS